MNLYKGLKNWKYKESILFDNVTSFTKSLDVAKNFTADGTSGIVIKTIIQPDQTLIDTNFLPENLYSHEEDEVIILSGLYKVEKIYEYSQNRF